MAFEQRHRGHCYICADCNYLDLMPTQLCYSTAGPVGSKAKAHAKRCHEIMLRHGFMEGQGDLRGHANRRGIRMRTVLIHVAWQIDGQEAALRNPVLRLHPPGAGFMNTHDFAKRLLSRQASNKASTGSTSTTSSRMQVSRLSLVPFP